MKTKKKKNKEGKFEMKKVEDLDTIPYAKTYVLKITHAYHITQFYRTVENFKNKLREYADFSVVSIECDAEKFTMVIKGELPKVVESKRIKLR